MYETRRLNGFIKKEKQKRVHRLKSLLVNLINQDRIELLDFNVAAGSKGQGSKQRESPNKLF